MSAWAAIIALPTFIASLYGMNFRHMPELSWGFGYGYALLLMVGDRRPPLRLLQEERLAVGCRRPPTRRTAGAGARPGRRGWPWRPLSCSTREISSRTS